MAEARRGRMAAMNAIGSLAKVERQRCCYRSCGRASSSVPIYKKSTDSGQYSDPGSTCPIAIIVTMTRDPTITYSYPSFLGIQLQYYGDGQQYRNHVGAKGD